MWNPMKSVRLSLVCTKLVIALAAVSAAAAPCLIRHYLMYTGKTLSVSLPLTVTFYLCWFPALAALFSLHRLLGNIRRQEVFVENNVACLRRISWCCFAVSLVLLTAGFYYILFVAAAVISGFFGLILRVVKNVIEQAVLLQRESDLTI